MKFLTSILFVFSLWSLRAQNQNETPFKINLGTGIANYHGDICPFLECLSPSYNLNASLRYFMTPQLNLRPQLSFFRLQAADERGNNKNRNLSFRSDNLSFSISLVYDFFPYVFQANLRKPITPFVNLGIGGLFFNPKAELNGQWHELQPLSTEGVPYNRFTFFIPLGGGIRIYVNKKIDLIVSYSYQFTFSDYLDDISNNYTDIDNLSGFARELADRTSELGVTPQQTQDGEHWQEGSPRGNGKWKDSYSTINIGLSIDLFQHEINF